MIALRFSLPESRHYLGHGQVDGQRDLGDVDVLLEMQQPHLQLGYLLLHRGRHLW